MKLKTTAAILMLVILFVFACTSEEDVPCGCQEDGDSDAMDGDSEPDVTATDGDASDGDEAIDGDADEAAVDNEPFRFVVISDTHIMQAEDAENNLRFMEAGGLYAAMDPAVDFVVSTGDNVEDLLCFPDINCEDPLPILTLYRDLLDTYFPMPFYIAFGNHDNRYFDGFVDTETPWNSWQLVFGDSDYLPAQYYAVDHKGFRFLVLNATDLAVDHDSNDEPTFSEAQLAWMDDQLSDGIPSLLFWHHTIHPPAASDVELPPILQMIRDHNDTVRAVFTGHEHFWWRTEWEGVRFYETDNFGKNSYMAYHLVACDPEDGSVTIANEADIDYGDR